MLDSKNCPPLIGQIQQLIRSRAEDAIINFSSSSAYTLPMVLGGIGVAIMPGFVIPEHPDIRKIPFETNSPISGGFEYGLAYHMGKLSNVQRSFIDVIKLYKG